MVIDRSEARDNPYNAKADKGRDLFGTRVAETILARGHVRPHTQRPDI